MKFGVASLTEAGPRATNEDSLDHWSLSNGALICAVADGLGGMGGGSTASSIAIDTLKAHINENTQEADLLNAVDLAHQAILEMQVKRQELRTMATTLTCGIFQDGVLFGAHCGDSRAVVARGLGIKRLTIDQTEGQRLFEAGKLTKSELKEYPRKNILDSALGDKKPPRLETFRFLVEPEDWFFFSTDGLHNKILLRELKQLAEGASNEADLIEAVRQEMATRDPDDNYSLIVVRTKSD